MDAAERFAAALKESEQREQLARKREREARAEADLRRAQETARANELAEANRDLEKAIETVRAARRAGKGAAAADEVWKLAKARVIELETGDRPGWAPAQAIDTAETVPEERPDTDSEFAESAEDTPAEDTPADEGSAP